MVLDSSATKLFHSSGIYPKKPHSADLFLLQPSGISNFIPYLAFYQQSLRLFAMKKIPLEPLIFSLLLLLALLPIWSVTFFVTGDGPCHLYNSKILLDWSRGEALDFYKPFYFLNQSLDPNWLTNLIQIPFLMLFPAPVAEKIFFSLYILLFAGGFRFLCRQINPESVFLSSLGILFAWSHIVMMGFCNNSLSLALWFWVVGYWWKTRDSSNFVALLFLAFLFFALYLAHPIGLFFAGLHIVALALGQFFYQQKQSNWIAAAKNLLQQGSKTILLALPSLILFAHFILKRDWTSEASPNTSNVWSNLLRMTALINLSKGEALWVMPVSIFCLLLLGLAIRVRWKERRWLETDGLLIFVFIALGVILNPPSSLSGGLEVPLRMVMVPFIALLFWMATVNFPGWAKQVSMGFAVVITVGLLWVRLPIHRAASKYAEEVYSLRYQISDQSRILVLNYDWDGHTAEGQQIADKIWLFAHVDCYLGAQSSLVISDNYEANFWYFPTIARWETNMYTQTDKEGINFDHRPPRADILSYNRRTQGQDIDYVLILSPGTEHAQHPYTLEIMEQLNQAYAKISTTEYGRAVLYRRK